MSVKVDLCELACVEYFLISHQAVFPWVFKKATLGEIPILCFILLFLLPCTACKPFQSSLTGTEQCSLRVQNKHKKGTSIQVTCICVIV